MSARHSSLVPIDSIARNGRYHLVFGGNDEFACVRWNGASGAWEFFSGVPLGFEPETYAASPGLPHYAPRRSDAA